jgi:hypothetical protein
MFTDFIINGQPTGDVGEAILNSGAARGGIHFDDGLMRPYVNERGVRCCDVQTGRVVVNKETGRMTPEVQQVPIKDLIGNGLSNPSWFATNATTLRKEEWIKLDEVVLRAARFPLRVWADLAAANSYGGFNGMSTMVLEHETMNDPGEAVVDFDGLSEARHDDTIFQLEGIPLPITHDDFFFSSRRLAISRNMGTPLDVSRGEAAGRRIGEQIEKTTIGTITGPSFGPGLSPAIGRTAGVATVNGYINFPARQVYAGTARAPTQTGWNPGWLLSDVLAMRQQMYNQKFTGPYIIYHSNDWDRYLDGSFYELLTSGAVAPTQTLRQRLKSIENISDVRRSDFMFSAAPAAGASQPYNTLVPFRLCMVQMTPDVARAINGMDITTVQWESQGGMRLNFKVMCIQVPQLRADYYGNCGILDATFTRTG